MKRSCLCVSHRVGSRRWSFPPVGNHYVATGIFKCNDVLWRKFVPPTPCISHVSQLPNKHKTNADRRTAIISQVLRLKLRIPAEFYHLSPAIGTKHAQL